MHNDIKVKKIEIHCDVDEMKIRETIYNDLDINKYHPEHNPEEVLVGSLE